MYGVIQLACCNFTCVPMDINVNYLGLPSGRSRFLQETIVTFADPRLALAMYGHWTPQLPMKLSGLRKCYPQLRKPTLMGVSFALDTATDLQSLLMRVGLHYQMQPEITQLHVTDDEGYDRFVNDVGIYSPVYLAWLHQRPEVISRIICSFKFDKLRQPAVKFIPRVTTNVYGSTEVPRVPEIQYNGPVAFVKEIQPISHALSHYASSLYKRLLASITV